MKRGCAEIVGGFFEGAVETGETRTDDHGDERDLDGDMGADHGWKAGLESGEERAGEFEEDEEPCGEDDIGDVGRQLSEAIDSPAGMTLDREAAEAIGESGAEES